LLSDEFNKTDKAFKAVAMVGARQAGKTTFLRHQMEGRNGAYVLFDDPDARGLFEEDVKKFEKRFVDGFDLSVLDEVQYCDDAGRKLKYLVDSGRRLWVTASSEMLLSKEILSRLVGRVAILRLYPFSLPEFLEAKGVKVSARKEAARLLWEHVVYGGYPSVVLADDLETKVTILRNLFETMILKDVAKTFSISDLPSLEVLCKFLALDAARQFSYESASEVSGLTFPTLQKYMDALEKSYLIKRVPPFFTNKKKEIVRQPKVFFIDNGVRNLLANDFADEPDGHVFENYVYTELIKIGHKPKYWHTKMGAEVDFVLEIGKEVVPVEAKLTAKPGKIERSLRAFINYYEPKRAYVVSYSGAKGKMEVNGCKIKFVDVLGLRKALG